MNSNTLTELQNCRAESLENNQTTDYAYSIAFNTTNKKTVNTMDKPTHKRCLAHLTTNTLFKLDGQQSATCGRTKVLLSILIFMLLLTALTQSTLAAPPKQEPPEKPSVIRGSALWQENCLPCHGSTGKGDGPTAPSLPSPPADFSDPELAKSRTLGDMFITARDGRLEKLMPPWSNSLTEQQIWDVVAYAQSLSTTSAQIKAGATVYAESCADCHGENGTSEAIDLTQPSLLVNQSTQAVFDKLRLAQGDHEGLSTLSDDELWQSLTTINTFWVEYPVYDGILKGQVLNGTTNETHANVTVVLSTFNAQGELMQNESTLSDENGFFTFEDLSRDHNVLYGVSGEYEGVPYFSNEPAVFMPDSNEATLNLTVYETTTDMSTIVQSRLHRIIVFEPGFINIADVYVFSNQGDKAVIGSISADGMPTTVQIGFAPQATDIAFQSNSIRSDGTGTYFDSQPIPPGTDSYDLFVTYSIPFEDDTVDVETPLFYPVETINIMATDQGQTIESEHLISSGTDNIRGTDYQRFASNGILTDETFVMTFSNLDDITMAPPSSMGNTGTQSSPQAVAPTKGLDQEIIMYSIIGLGIVMIIFAIVYTNQTDVNPTNKPISNLIEERTKLLTLLSELEILYKNGEIDETAYQYLKRKNRASLKQVLAQLL